MLLRFLLTSPCSVLSYTAMYAYKKTNTIMSFQCFSPPSHKSNPLRFRDNVVCLFKCMYMCMSHFFCVCPYVTDGSIQNLFWQLYKCMNVIYVHDKFLHNSKYVILDRKGNNIPSIPITYLMYSFLCQNETNDKRRGEQYWLRSWKLKLDKYTEMRFDGRKGLLL